MIGRRWWDSGRLEASRDARMTLIYRLAIINFRRSWPRKGHDRIASSNLANYRDLWFDGFDYVQIISEWGDGYDWVSWPTYST